MVTEPPLETDQPQPSPPSRRSFRSDTAVENLDVAECWRLVEASRLGRLAVDSFDGSPDVFPLNFLVHGGNLYVRSAPGTKLRSIAQKPTVAFEIDGTDERFHWSVVIRGIAQRMTSEEEIARSGVLDLISWSPTETHDFLRLVPSAISGRRFPRQRRPTRIGFGPDPIGIHPFSAGHLLPSPAVPVLNRDPGKPQPIPHFPPLPH
jgi:hypothetical protein